MNWRTVTWVIDGLMRERITPPVLDHQATQARRKGVRRTVGVLVAVVAVFYLIAFMQIIMLKLM